MRTLLAVVFCVAPALADGIHVEGKVTDAKGQPATGVEYGAEWTTTKAGKLAPFQPLKVGADGTVTGHIKWIRRPMAILALTPDKKTGGIRILEEKDLAEPLPTSVQLGPAFEAKATFACPELGALPAPAMVQVLCRPSEALVYRFPLREGRLNIHLPPGDYEVRVTAPDTLELRKHFTIENAAVDLGALALEPSAIARCWGKAPPAFSVTEARGVEPALKLEDLKGRWVLVVFWSATTDNATRSMFPRLIEFVEQQKDAADKFAILALHDTSAKSWAEYDAAVEKPRTGAWGGKDLPFPVLLDATGHTIKAWGVEKLPVTVLIDPEGKVVQGGSEYVLIDKIRAR